VKTVIRALQVEPRAGNARDVAEATGAHIIWDVSRNAMTTFLTALGYVGDDAALHLEDDIELTAGFNDKAAAVLAEHPDDVVQFFSNRAGDVTVGSRWEPGRSFMMNQCFYLPAGMSRDLLAYAPTWRRREEHPTGYDLMLADFLKDAGLLYWLHVPSLVQHMPWRSEINSRRSAVRASRTYESGR
jgi:hypothetical protein